jgi:hypothetical protein
VAVLFVWQKRVCQLLKREEVMKDTERLKHFALCFWGFALVLVVLVFCVSGCGYVWRGKRYVDRGTLAVLTAGSEAGAFAQVGETEAEVHRRHIRNNRVNQQEMMTDIDKFLLRDKPSKLSRMRIP